MSDIKEMIIEAAVNEEVIYVSQKNSDLTTLIGDAFTEDTVSMFNKVKTDTAVLGAALIKAHGQIARMARSVEMRMIDVERAEGSGSPPRHTFDIDKLTNVLDKLQSRDREHDSDGLIASIAVMKESCRKNLMAIADEFESGVVSQKGVVLALLSESFCLLAQAAVEIEGWVIDSKGKLSDEVRNMAKLLGL